MARSDRKIRKKRGSRSCGGGSHKKSRGAGGHGGKGMAGSHKSKWTWIIKYDPDHFGRSGFKIPKTTKIKGKTINVGGLENLLQIKKGRKRTLDLSKFNYHKVLGNGQVRIPLIVKAESFTKNAILKIESAGGKAISLLNSEGG
jgi:large subunit ribosomal protein L15